MSLRKNLMKSEIKNPKEMDINNFALHLLEMDPRIKAYDVFGGVDQDDNFGYIPRKDLLLFPVKLPAIEHEIAHMVEMRNSERWTKPDWGMISPNKSKSYSQWQTSGGFFAALAREIRVRAIQLHMCPQIDWASTTYNILQNHLWQEMAFNRLHFGRFKCPSDIQQWVNDLRDKTYNAWSLERIEHEWIIRLNYIQNWMETKDQAA